MHIIHPVCAYNPLCSVLVGNENEAFFGWIMELILVENENEAFLGWIMEWIQGYLGSICTLIRVDYSKWGGLMLTQT